jgi:thioredoxin:protein disulfide reductase
MRFIEACVMVFIRWRCGIGRLGGASLPGRWGWGVVLVIGSVVCQAGSPFTVLPSMTVSNGAAALRVRFGLPADHHVYADKVSFRWAGENGPLAATMPKPVLVLDKFSGEQKRAYERAFEAELPIAGAWTSNRTLEVRLQGCNEAECYFPETRAFAISPTGEVTPVKAGPAAVAAASGARADWQPLAAGFQVVARGTGYMNTGKFLSFLDGATSGKGAEESSVMSLRRWGWLATFGLILLGGIGLNLTPCILPLIPINLSIIGAGARNSSRRRGFGLGATYGLGMAAAYGVLGLVVVLTGSKFGTLNSSPWFNLVIAGVFVVLALSMFDKLAIDFSRFRSRLGGGGKPSSGGPYLVALSMGGVAALLAGACVAPVVISVLLLATNLYNQGNWLGLLLPFCLGFGMALPWPVAGAGLSFLPKPGAWMTKVKYGFGALIGLFALYYAHLASTQFRPTAVFARQAHAEARPDGTAEATADPLVAALEQARVDGKPVVIDFWASWCKNCSAMEHTTFADEKVRQRLGSFHQVKYQAERPNEFPAKPILDHFGVMGLPTYVVLAPPPAAGPSH